MSILQIHTTDNRLGVTKRTQERVGKGQMQDGFLVMLPPRKTRLLWRNVSGEIIVGINCFTSNNECIYQRIYSVLIVPKLIIYVDRREKLRDDYSFFSEGNFGRNISLVDESHQFHWTLAITSTLLYIKKGSSRSPFPELPDPQTNSAEEVAQTHCSNPCTSTSHTCVAS